MASNRRAHAERAGTSCNWNGGHRDFRFARFCDRGLADRRCGWPLKRRQVGNQPRRQLMKSRKRMGHRAFLNEQGTFRWVWRPIVKFEFGRWERKLEYAIRSPERQNSEKRDQDRCPSPGNASQRHVKHGRGADPAWRRRASQFAAAATREPEGFWESSVIMTLNDEILAAGGSDWRDWREFDSGRIVAAARAALQERAKSALAGEFGDSKRQRPSDVPAHALLDLGVSGSQMVSPARSCR